MKKQETIYIILMFIGLIIITVSYLDIISIVANVLNRVFDFNLPEIWLNSFHFRAMIILIGSLFLLIGGLLYKKKK